MNYQPTAFGARSVTSGAMLAIRSLISKAGALPTSLALGAALLLSSPANAQDRLPWDSPQQSHVGAGSDAYAARGDVYRPDGSYSGGSSYPQQPAYQDDAYRSDEAYRPNDAYRPQGNGNGDAYVPPPPGSSSHAYRNDVPEHTPDYAPYPETAPQPYERDYGPPPPEYDSPPAYGEPPPAYDDYDRRTYSRNEIMDAGHAFFGSISQGLASVVEYAFQKAGRPNGYILGEDAGGAFVAGLRYGEGTLFTKDAGTHKVYWQGPSIGYDFGGEGTKTMVLVYNLRHPGEIYHRFGGVQGSAYLVGGVSVQFQKHGDVVLAPIRSGVGFRLGANVGYLKYTRNPTWNPF